MIIREVILENILSHESTRVEFIRGVNVIVGSNGSGKSSIIDSILLALIAPCTSALEEVVRAKLDNILRVGSQRGEVRVEVEVGGSTYIVKRTIERRGPREAASTMTLYDHNNRLLAKGREEVCSKVKSILGLHSPHKVLTSTLVSRQGFLTELLDMSPSERKERILELAGLQKLEEAKESLREVIRNLKFKVDLLRSKKENLKNREMKLRSIESEIGRLEGDIGELRKTLDGKLLEKSELEEKLSKLEKALKVWDRLKPLEELRQLIDEKERELERLRIEFSRLPQVDQALLEEIQKTWSLASDMEKRVGKAQAEVENLKSRIESFTKEAVEKLKEAGIEAGDIKGALEALDAELMKRVEALGALDAELKSVESLINVKPLEERCPFCGAPLTRDRLEHIIMEHKRRLEELKARKSVVSGEKRRLENVKNTVSRLNTNIEMDSREIEKALSNMEEAKRELEKFLNKCSEISPIFNVVKVAKVSDCPVKAVGELLNKRRELEVKIRETEKYIKDLREKFDEKAYRDLVEEWRKLSEGVDIASLEAEYESVRGEIRALENTIDEIKNRISKNSGALEALKKEALEIKSEIENLKAEIEKLPVKERILEVSGWVSDNLLGKEGLLALRLTEALKKSLESEANHILKLMGRDFNIKVHEDFTMTVMRGDQQLDVRSLSGGEKTMLAIAFRLTLASLLIEKPISTLILDEPTEYLDENSRKTVFEIIRKIAGYIDQVIVVTHDTEVEEIADRLISVSKDGGRSIVKVEV
ncbi:MAG: AAA family ATPase [Thermoprotei archaeon]|nr:AAA family ATPase [Thermoprotei archaeon]